jgi:hypothetical protein
MRLTSPAIVTLGLAFTLAALAVTAGPQLPPDGSIPGWLRQMVSESGRSPPEIEKVTYNGQPAFELIATDRADTGDEHALYSASGTLICRFGGYVGRVTSGSCNIEKIIYVSTLYSPKRR